MLRDMANDCDLETDSTLQQSILDELIRDHKPIPREVLREVRTILEDVTREPPPSEKLRYVRDLLRPFLTDL